MDNTSICAIILAAGEGKRMQSELPKVLHEVAGKPLLFYSVETLESLKLGQLIVVLKYKHEMIADQLTQFTDVTVALQGNSYGTGTALTDALPSVQPEITDVVILYGDNAMFVKPKTYQQLIAQHRDHNNTFTLATREVDEPKSSGKIVRDEHGNILGIVEKKDATEEQLLIKEVNPGLYIIKKDWLLANKDKLEPSPVTGEYYVTDFLKLAIAQGKKVEAINFGKTDQWKGVTTQDDVAKLNEWIKTR